MIGRLARFAYPLRRRKDRDLLPYQLRDAEAAAHIIPLLCKMGRRYVGAIVNYPSPGPDIIPYDLTVWNENDLLLLVTRPPMHDALYGTLHHIPRSFTQLEDTLFRGPLAHCFDECARHVARLTDEVAALSPEIAARQAMEFHQHNGASYQAYGSPRNRPFTRFTRRTPARSAAFLVYAEHAWPGGPALLAAFGMGGVETLVWIYHLTTRFPHLLCTTPFAMGEITYGPLTDGLDPMGFANKWDVRILGQA